MWQAARVVVESSAGMAWLGALLIAVIGAVGGAIAAGVGGWLRSRRSVQSAARLVHAELTDNSAAIRYYRKVGQWPTIGEVRHAAWDQQGPTLSRMRQAAPFHTIQQGYSALEGIAFVAHPDSQGLPPSVAREILNDTIEQVSNALRAAGVLGAIDERDLEMQREAMAAQSADGGAGIAHLGTGVIPSATLDAIARAGTAAQQASAKTTLESMEVRVAATAQVTVAGPNRVIRDAKNGDDLTAAQVVRTEGEAPTGDQAADEFYDGLGDAHRFFQDVFGRDSFDGRGAVLEGVVHFGQKFNNLFWDGQRVVSGDGDGELFNRFTIALEMIGHEVALGVIQTDSKLAFLNQAGAVTSGIANVFGALIKQYSTSETVEEADWLLGAGLLGPKVKGVALMSLAAPGTAYDDPVLGKDPQPAHMRDFVRTTTDLGGVHVNSGIPSHAFYTTAKALGGYAWERAGRIWYEALHDPRLRANSGYQAFATATRSVAAELYGVPSDEVAAVDAGWQKVGVKYTSRGRAA